jgi:hypothetical protein
LRGQINMLSTVFCCQDSIDKKSSNHVWHIAWQKSEWEKINIHFIYEVVILLFLYSLHTLFVLRNFSTLLLLSVYGERSPNWKGRFPFGFFFLYPFSVPLTYVCWTWAIDREREEKNILVWRACDDQWWFLWSAIPNSYSARNVCQWVE